jgi:hypothetical protein
MTQGLHLFKKITYVSNITVSIRFKPNGLDTPMTLAALITVAFIAFLARGAMAAGARLEQISQERLENAEFRQAR